jgi:hypothetical protein
LRPLRQFLPGDAEISLARPLLLTPCFKAFAERFAWIILSADLAQVKVAGTFHCGMLDH